MTAKPVGKTQNNASKSADQPFHKRLSGSDVPVGKTNDRTEAELSTIGNKNTLGTDRPLNSMTDTFKHKKSLLTEGIVENLRHTALSGRQTNQPFFWSLK